MVMMPASASSRSRRRNPEPLVVSPRAACRLLDCGHSHLYQLLGSAALESFRSGRSRKITVASINRYIARQIKKDRLQPRDESGDAPALAG
jgi:hypothetical protein